MVKKFFLFFSLFAFLTVQAHATSQEGLKALFDELHYSLSVEWDQKDKGFYNQQMEKFANEIKKYQASGLTNQELIDYTIAQVKDENLARDLRTAFSMILINNMKAVEAQQYVADMLKKSYDRGASWSGGATVAGFIAVIVMVAIAAVVFGKAKVEDGCYKVWKCEDHCALGTCYEECEYECIN